jgi:primary-amine oxidase
MPHGAVPCFTSEQALVSRRAAFIRNHLWVTPFAEDQRFPAGPYVNQSTGEDGIDVWTEQDRPVENTDLVVWHTFGHHHLPRPEDFPVQPVVSTGFTLQPFGFFPSDRLAGEDASRSSAYLTQMLRGSTSER